MPDTIPQIWVNRLTFVFLEMHAYTHDAQKEVKIMSRLYTGMPNQQIFQFAH